jgi:hypothetical protein
MALLAAPAVSFVGMSRFRFEGSSSRSRRNLSPPRRTPLQATRTKYRNRGKARESFARKIHHEIHERHETQSTKERPTEQTDYTEKEF